MHRAAGASSSVSQLLWHGLIQSIPSSFTVRQVRMYGPTMNLSSAITPYYGAGVLRNPRTVPIIYLIQSSLENKSNPNHPSFVPFLCFQTVPVVPAVSPWYESIQSSTLRVQLGFYVPVEIRPFGIVQGIAMQ